MSVNIEIIIAGGGTAGHTNPGIAVAQALVEKGLDSDSILFVGSQRGGEAVLVPEAGFKIETLPGRGIPRKIGLAPIKAALSLLKGVFLGIGLVRKTKPKAVLCLGGYAALPASIGALLSRVPIIVSEQNARASAVNRIIGKFAKACALPFPDTDLPKGKLTGNPVRSSISPASAELKAAARAELGIDPDRFLVAVWSGSLGASSVNAAVAELADIWQDRDDIYLYHVVGKREFGKYKLADQVANYRVVEYENEMERLLHAADIAVARSGASTVGELSVAALPSILIPLPGAPRDHQTANTAELEGLGAAVVLNDSELSGNLLAAELDAISYDSERLADMSRKAATAARPDARNLVAEMLLEAGELNVS